MKYTLATAASCLILVVAGCSSSVDTSNTSIDIASSTSSSLENSLATTQATDTTQATATTAKNTFPSTTTASKFAVSSPDMADGTMPIAFTCDGQSKSPSVAWTAGPAGTVGYAIAMHHVPGPGDTHWYWVVYNIPATTLSVAAGQASIGTLGTNSVNANLAYAPPCSKGPGAKMYTISVYALSASPIFANGVQVSRDVLLSAISGTTLASSSIDVTYERS